MTGKKNRFGHPRYHMYVHAHNGAVGRVCHSYRFLQSMLTLESLTEDARHHVETAMKSLALAEEEIRMRRVEPDGSITLVGEKVSAKLYKNPKAATKTEPVF